MESKNKEEKKGLPTRKLLLETGKRAIILFSYDPQLLLPSVILVLFLRIQEQ